MVKTKHVPDAHEQYALHPDSTQLQYVCKTYETVTSDFMPGETFTHLTRQQDEGVHGGTGFLSSEWWSHTFYGADPLLS